MSTVQPGDAVVLRDRLLWMATHSGEALEMGRNGRAKVEEKFSPAQHYEQFMAVYKKVGAG